MFKIVLTVLAAMLVIPVSSLWPPDLIGLGTYYGPPAFSNGALMRNGEALDLSEATMAVDDSQVEWVDRWAVVLTECGELHRVRVTDTGMLEAAGKVCYGVGPLNQARYWPEDRIDVKWADGAVKLPFVADFPAAFFHDEIACVLDAYGQGGTVMLAVWVLEPEEEGGGDNAASD